MFANVGQSKNKADVLKQLISAKKEIRGRDTERVLGEQAFFEDVGGLFKPLIETQKRIGVRQQKALANMIKPREKTPAIAPGVGAITSEVEEPFVTEPIEERIELVEPDYPDLDFMGMPGLDVKIGKNWYLPELPKSRDELNGLSLEDVYEYKRKFDASYLVLYDHLKKPVVIAKTKPDNIRNARTNLGKAGKYVDYLRRYIDWRESIPPPLEDSQPGAEGDVYGRGFKKRAPKNKGGCIQILGTPKEILNELSLAVASIDAGNTSSMLKNKVITIADYLYKNEHIRKPMYLELLKVIK